MPFVAVGVPAVPAGMAVIVTSPKPVYPLSAVIVWAVIDGLTVLFWLFIVESVEIDCTAVTICSRESEVAELLLALIALDKLSNLLY